MIGAAPGNAARATAVLALVVAAGLGQAVVHGAALTDAVGQVGATAQAGVAGVSDSVLDATVGAAATMAEAIQALADVVEGARASLNATLGLVAGLASSLVLTLQTILDMEVRALLKGALLVPLVVENVLAAKLAVETAVLVVVNATVAAIVDALGSTNLTLNVTAFLEHLVAATLVVPNPREFINLTLDAVAEVASRVNVTATLRGILAMAGPVVAAAVSGALAVALGVASNATSNVLAAGAVVVGMVALVLLSLDLATLTAATEAALRAAAGIASSAAALVSLALQAMLDAGAALGSLVTADLHLQATTQLVGMAVNHTVNLTKLVVLDLRAKQDLFLDFVLSLDPLLLLTGLASYLVDELLPWASDNVNRTMGFLGTTVVGSIGSVFALGSFAANLTRALVRFGLDLLRPLGVPLPNTPSAPTLAVAPGPGPGNITLTWTPPASDGGLAVSSYRIYRGSAPGVAPIDERFIAEVGNVTTFQDTGLPPGATRFYRVSAVNLLGEGPASNEASATAPV